MIPFALLLSLLQATPDPAGVQAPDDQGIVVNGATGCGPRFAKVYIAPMGQPFRTDGTRDPVTLWFAAADTDHDGKLTFAEFAADADRFFSTLDSNHDGEIDPQEIIVYESQIAPEIRLYQRGGNPGDHRPITGKERKAAKRAARDRADYNMAYGAGKIASLNIPEPVASADLDINRGVSRQEFATVAASRFQLLDSAGRGYLTYDAMPLSPAQKALDACRAAARKSRR